MKIPLRSFRTLAALALTFLVAGCAELHTNAPFGDALDIKPEDKSSLDGLWEYPAPAPEFRVTYDLKCDASGDKGVLVARNASGKTWTYDLVFRKVEGKEGGGPVVFFKRRDSAEKDWRFAWVGEALASNDRKAAGGKLTCLVLVFPDEKGSQAFGLETVKGSYPAYGSGVPAAGALSEKPASIPDKDWEKMKNEKEETRTLSESPDAIMAKLRDKDLRTMMLPLNPLVLIRANKPADAK